VPITNAWPTTASAVFTAPLDFTGVTTAGCGLGLILRGATVADQIQIGYIDFAPVAENETIQNLTVTNTVNLPGGSTGGNASGCVQSPVLGISNGYICPTKGFLGVLGGNQGITDNTAVFNTTAGFPTAACFFVDTEFECYTGLSGNTATGITRGLYGSTATTHNSGASAPSAQIVFGATNQLPPALMAYGGGEPPLLAINNPFPANRNMGSVSSVFSLNSGSNETWVDTGGSIHQQNTSGVNQLGPTLIGFSTLPFESPVAASGYLLQANLPGTALSPQSLAGGHAGTFNVIQPQTIGAPVLGGALPSGAGTASWVCSGLDADGNTIPGTTVTVTGVAATWTFPQGIGVGCPWTAGVVTFNIWRTAGSGSQGLIGTGTNTGNGYWVSDFGGATSGGTPPVSNTSNPTISVQGSGNPTITMGTVQILNGAGVPTGCGTTYGNGSLYMNNSGGHSTSNLIYVCDAATTTWVDIE
jgi:hypothetical protein